MVDATGEVMNSIMYLRPAEMAASLSISTRQLWQWQHDRVIPFIKLGKTILFDPHKVREALERFERNAGAAK